MTNMVLAAKLSSIRSVRGTPNGYWTPCGSSLGPAREPGCVASPSPRYHHRVGDEVASKRVRGTVCDDAGAPLAGARVIATRDDTTVTSATGDDGSYELEL